MPPDFFKGTARLQESITCAFCSSVIYSEDRKAYPSVRTKWKSIADRFFLSLKTVKRHNSNLHANLDAMSRTQAVSLARSLKLID